MSMTWLFADHAAKSKLSTPIALNNLRVASPCRADWTQMSGDDRVRHCSECKLNVYNLSEMSRREAEELIASREGRSCVRFYRRADGTVITRDCPIGLRHLVRKVSRVAGTVLSALMSVGFCAAQTAPKSAPQATTQNDQKRAEIAITVIDPQGAVVSGAQVIAVDKETGIRFRATSNSSGHADLSRLKPGTYRIEISAKWFLTSVTTLTLTPDKVERINAKLTPDPKGTVIIDLCEMGSPLIQKDSTVVHTFDGNLLKAVSPH